MISLFVNLRVARNVVCLEIHEYYVIPDLQKSIVASQNIYFMVFMPSLCILFVIFELCLKARGPILFLIVIPSLTCLAAVEGSFMVL